jgi:hypothetical protein
MTTSEKILIIIIIYFLFIEVLHFINIACDYKFCDYRKLKNLFWVIFFPLALLKQFFEKFF